MSGFVLIIAGSVLIGVAIAFALITLFAYLSYKAFLDD